MHSMHYTVSPSLHTQPSLPVCQSADPAWASQGRFLPEIGTGEKVPCTYLSRLQIGDYLSWCPFSF